MTPEGAEFIVTLDVTIYSQKTTAKADLLVPEIIDPSEDENKFIKQTTHYGQQIAEIILERQRLAA
jgi:hypothetical protein